LGAFMMLENYTLRLPCSSAVPATQSPAV